MLVLFFLAFTLGCEKGEQLNDNLIETKTEKSDYELKIQFAQTLAKSVVDKDIRAFLKKEALLKVDGDYNVFFNLSKNKEIGETKISFIDKLELYNEGEISIRKISEQIPLLNIGIPSFIMASTEEWNTDLYVPLVVVSEHELLNELCSYLKSFNSKGETVNLDKQIEPCNTVLVVDESERIFCDMSSLKRMAKDNVEFLMSDQEQNYYLTVYHEIVAFEDEDISDGSNNSSISPRERLYYSSGEMNYNIFENMSRFRMSNTLAVKGMTDTWLEQTFEIECNIILGGTAPDAFRCLKQKLSIDRALLTFVASNNVNEFLAGYTFPSGMMGDAMKKAYKKVYEEINNSNKYVTSSDGKKWLPMNMELFNWSPHRYGDVVKLIFFEHDNGETVSREISHQVGFNASIGKKDKFNLGITGSKSGKVTISYTNTSDELGEGFVYYYEDYGINNYRRAGNIEFVLEPKL